jgi:hypothetical protein
LSFGFLLCLEPLIGALLSLFLTQAISLLQFAGESFPAPRYVIDVVVGQISPLLFDGTFHLFPLSSDFIPAHGGPPFRSPPG